MMAQPAPPLRSKIKNGFFSLAIPFFGLFFIVGLYLLDAAWDAPNPTLRLNALPFLLLPLYLNHFVFNACYSVRVEDKMVALRSLSGCRAFALSDIAACAVTHRKFKNDKTEILHLELPGGEIVKIEEALFQNYPEIRTALIKSKKTDPVLQSKALKDERLSAFRMAASLFGIAALVWCYVWYERQKPPLTAADMLSVRATLVEKPFVETTGSNRSKRSLVKLYTREFPDHPFVLRDIAFGGAEVAALTNLLKAGDTFRVMLRKIKRESAAQAPKTEADTRVVSFDAYAVFGNGRSFLTLAAYDRQLNVSLFFTLLTTSFFVLLALSLLGWRYWQYKKNQNI